MTKWQSTKWFVKKYCAEIIGAFSFIFWVIFITCIVLMSISRVTNLQTEISNLQQQVVLQRAAIEALEDKTQDIADSIGLEW